jgi:hypothetical protein
MKELPRHGREIRVEAGAGADMDHGPRSQVTEPEAFLDTPARPRHLGHGDGTGQREAVFSVRR